MTDIFNANIKEKFTTGLKLQLHAALFRGLARENDAMDEAKAESFCDMGVGCGVAGVCYAERMGKPDFCGKRDLKERKVCE